MRAEIAIKGLTFTVGENDALNKPLENLCGLVEPPDWRQTGKFDGGYKGELGLPTSWDWRDQGVVTNVQNQGSCGSCWAFGTIGSYESCVAVAGGGLDDLSEEWLLDCNTLGYGCNGGWWGYPDMYDGVPLESCYPYVGSESTCNTSCPKYHPMADWYYVGNSSSVPSTTDLKNAMYEQGPLSVAVCVDSYFQAYTGGIFTHTSSGQPNHAVILVGWDDSGGYWIMKNSWGTGWGESGYMRIAWGANSIGYAASYGVPESVTPQPPVADFSADPTTVQVGNSVQFTDLTTNNPTSWDWTFAGGTPSSSSSQNPQVTYNTIGTYTVALTATNAQGSDTETKVDYITVQEVVIEYCESSGGSQSYEYIAGVEISDLSNSSGPSGYSDFTYMTATVLEGESADVSLTPGFTGSPYTEYWRIWIDYNVDGDFDDDDEEVFSGSGSSTVNGSFTPPPCTGNVITRMRVSMSYGTYPPMCGSFTYGEVEDYTVNIIGTGFNAEDLVVRTSDARLLLFPFENGTFVGSGKKVGHGWNFTDYLVGNWNNDYDTHDLIVRSSSGTMRLYPYRNETFYTYGSIQVGQNFNYTHYFVGNWTDNGTDDLIVRDSNGYLWLLPYVEDVGFGAGTNLGGGWNYTHYFVGNWSGNGTPDLICRDSNGNMWFFKFNNGTFSPAKKVGNGWYFTHYFVGNWTGDGTDDLIVRDSSGTMHLYPFRNESFYYVPGAGKIVATGWNFTNYFVGDWKNNCTDDMIVRESNGNLKLYPFENDTFGSGTTAGTGFNYTHYFVGQWTDQ